ncbi:hypothetical protein C8C77_10411 [Halanaerobium saccharolyticum]|uniref:Uncharacterized protein n=1 Tax=Halanaerobium saccharolyticum TaxID=43595 RepID=A0A4R7Z6T7_9FIRM|nr:hypothetical protein [Halanaerobium saccharolyticum]RAK10620.1 hypothetical protein C7958_104141 [Halanaerobium saccharolyticum]TDW06623.1 hypothetical protein C8C77_10411 [Halanaerobium saccharolyticum]TDX62258.1 hypothetical protein C7956_10411 [Halanaerobium saccharolyticum]
MKKLLVMVLAMLLVMGVSAVGLAADAEADVDVMVTVDPYYDVWFDTPGSYKGLFGNTMHPIGQPGIYISDGQATVNSVTGIWSNAIAAAVNSGVTSGQVYQDYFDEGQLGDPQVELFKVDANTIVDVTLSADFTGWMNAPTLFRVSSDDDNNYINGYGDWATDLAVVGNTVNPVFNGDYNDLLNEHNMAVEGLDDTFTLDFAEELLCHGPIDFHLNGALWMPKASQVAAGDYEATVIVTVAAANGQDS